MYKIPANTLFVGKDLIFVPECHSTNTFALELSNLPSTKEGTVIVTDHQTAGRGQRGSSWETTKGMNLTFSVILKPSFLSIKDQFALNTFSALAIHDVLDKKSIEASIKWPNDVLINDKKVCGILIENQIRGSQVSNSIVGIGLNVNQDSFHVPTATSLRNVLNVVTDLSALLELVLEHLEKRYLQLKSGRLADLRSAFMEQLYWRNEQHSFVSGGITFKGTITGIDAEGRLEVATADGIKKFELKQISLVQ